jgi:hypothetical protein
MIRGTATSSSITAFRTPPSLTLVKGPADPVTGIRPVVGTIEYDMGNGSTNWSIRADLVSWTTADGITHPGGVVLGPMTPTQQTGTQPFTFTPPSGAQQVSVRATASNCRGRVTDDASINCDACEGTADPVFFTDGNVRGDVCPSRGGIERGGGVPRQ